MPNYMLKERKRMSTNDRKKVCFRLECRQRHRRTRKFKTKNGKDDTAEVP